MNDKTIYYLEMARTDSTNKAYFSKYSDEELTSAIGVILNDMGDLENEEFFETPTNIEKYISVLFYGVSIELEKDKNKINDYKIQKMNLENQIKLRSITLKDSKKENYFRSNEPFTF